MASEKPLSLRRKAPQRLEARTPNRAAAPNNPKQHPARQLFEVSGGPAPHLRDPLLDMGRGFSDAALAVLERCGTRALSDRLGYAWPAGAAAQALDLPELHGAALLHAPLDLLAEAVRQPPELPGVTVFAATKAVLDMGLAIAAVSLLPRFCRSLGPVRGPDGAPVSGSAPALG